MRESEIVQAREESEDGHEELFQTARCLDAGGDRSHSTFFYTACAGDDPVIIKEVEPHPSTFQHLDHIPPLLTVADDMKWVQDCIDHPVDNQNQACSERRTR